MATARAIASGNWSSTSTWNGGVLPGNGDTVYANTFTVTIDQNVTIGGVNNPIVNAGSFVSGQWYEITTSGTTNFTLIGAGFNTVGTIFQANGAGSGSGQARARATLTTALNAAAGAAAGGSFIVSSTWSVPCDLRAGTTNCLTLSGSANFTQSDLIFVGGNATNQNALVNIGTGTISVTSCTIAANQQIAIQNTSTGSVVANSCVLTGPIGVSGGAIVNTGASPSSITITGSTIAGANTSQTILSSSTGTVTISTSTITGGNGSNAPTVNITGTGIVNISNSNLNAGNTASAWALQSNGNAPIICANCTFTASSASSAVNATSSSADYQFSGSFIDAVNGFKPITCSKFKLGSQPLNAFTRYALSGTGTYVNMFTADNNLNQANPTDVRAGVSYASGFLTGRLTVPAEGTVANGVTVGPNMPLTTATRSGTTATAFTAFPFPYQASDTIVVTGASNAEWNDTYNLSAAQNNPTQTAGAFNVGSIYAIASVGTTNFTLIGAASNTVGLTFTATGVGTGTGTATLSGSILTFPVPASHSASAGSGATAQTVGQAMLTAANIAAALTAQGLTTARAGNLDLLDATVSSRLAPSGTLATVTNLTNAPTVPTAAAIASQVRTELGTELGRLDAAVSTRLATSGYTAPSNSDVAAIKAKTDLLNTDRLAQASTVATTGAQIAAALS